MNKRGKYIQAQIPKAEVPVLNYNCTLRCDDKQISKMEDRRMTATTDKKNIISQYVRIGKERDRQIDSK